MCGIAGIFSKSPPDATLLQRMAQSLAHRGPDDEGVWSHGPSGIGFAHRRLSIVDLSVSGHQPMLSADGRFVLNFNGEIYNHRRLRSDLEKAGAVPNCGWRGHSDTETLLQAISTWGLDGAIGRTVGMFAIALWDSKTRILALARDRFGEKPLYYGWAGRDFVFGSELKALRLHPQFDNPISRRALQLFAARTHVPAPFSIYERIFKLPVGCILEVDRDACSAPLADPPEENGGLKGLKLRRYWSYRDVMRRGLADQIRDPIAALAELEKTLAGAIVDQSIADVPVGAFLSGGIDSSTIVALYQKHSNVPVRSYTIAFEEGGYNEAEDARRVAAHLGTVHHEQRVSAREASDVIPLLPNIYDEPFADSSQIPTFLVSRLARQEVKVALSGDGGDELFGGYARHFSAPAVWQQARRLPQAVRRFAGSALAQVPVSVWAGVNELLPGRRPPHFGSKVQKAFRVLSRAQTIEDVYCSFLDEWCFEESPVRGITPSVPIHVDASLGGPDALRVMYYDTMSYLPDDILCKVDRAGMAVSLETRIPFLDHRVAEVAARIPLEFKIAGGEGKKVLRSLLRQMVPDDLFDRPKAGFAIPLSQWLRGPLRAWAEELLGERRLADQGWFNSVAVRRRWLQHLTGQRDSAAAIWAILMFQAWLDEQRGRTALAA
jgi:asparagine synthase (glutamine-hydrolysing)